MKNLKKNKDITALLASTKKKSILQTVPCIVIKKSATKFLASLGFLAAKGKRKLILHCL